jgi:putative MATE family efflux protein
MRIYSLGTLFVQLTLGMNAFITAQGFTVTSMKTVMIGAGLNIILDPIFIFLFHMGVQGAALATIISQAVSALWVLRFLRGSNTKWKLRRKNLRPYAKVTLPCVALGSASFVMQSTESLIAVCFNSSLLKYGGDVAVGSMTVLTGIMQLVLMPVQGLGQGAQPLISFNYGARNAQRVREAFRCLLVFSLSCTLIFCTVIQIIPRPFVMLFNNNPELVDYAVWALRIYSFGLSIFGIQMACQQTFVSLGNAKTSLFLAVWRKIILLIPLIYILPPFFENKTFAVFLAEPIADILAVITTAILFSMQFKKSMALLESPEI